MRKTVMHVALLTMLVVGLATAGAAAFEGIIVGGVATHEAKLDPYFYFEGTFADSISIGVGGYHSVFGASLWLGSSGGPYGEVTWVDGFGSSPDSVEVGLWRGFDMSDSLVVYGWAGVNHELGGGSPLALTLNAEAQIGLGGPLSVVVGGGTKLTQGNSGADGYLGLGYSF